jgi:hypothetical protein
VAGLRVWRAKRVLRKLIGAWEDFGRVLSQSALEETSEPSVDKGLLELEARIAVYLPSLYDLYSGTYLDDEIREEVRSIGELVKRFTGKSLSGRLTQDEVKSMVAEWNSHFVFLNKLMGSRAGGAPAEEEDMLETAGARVRRPGGLSALGRNSALRFVAKAVVVIILAVLAVNILGDTTADLLSGAVTKLTGQADSTSAGPGYSKSPGVTQHIVSWQQRVRVFTAEHRPLITMVAVVIVAFAVLYLILFRST